MAAYNIAPGKKLDLLVGDITRQQVDAIVNAANGHLAHGGGVARAISTAAGPELQRESDRVVSERGPIPTGQVAATAGYKLPAQYVIHAVGPVWQGGAASEPELLANCYRNALRLADELGCSSIAFPSISTGIFGYPAEPAAEVALRAIVETAPALQHLKEVSLVLFGASVYDVYTKTANSLGLAAAG